MKIVYILCIVKIVCIVCCGVFLLCVVCVMSCVSCVCFRGSILRGSHPSGPCLTCFTTPGDHPGDHLVPDPLPQTPKENPWCQPPKISPFFPLLPPQIPVCSLSGGSSRGILVVFVVSPKLVACEMNLWALCENFGPSFWSTHPSGSHPSGPTLLGALIFPSVGPPTFGASTFGSSRFRSSPLGPPLF